MPRSKGDLHAYRAKRDFAHTPEPRAPDSKPSPAPAHAHGDAAAHVAPRFVIHEHHARRLHWDLRLERDGVLASWAIPKGLPDSPGENHFAAATEDHPLEYLDFQAQIPNGQYGAGRMDIYDTGTYDVLKWQPRKIEVALHGQRVRGRYALFATGGDRREGDWMIHRMDPPSDPRREPMPEHVVPMLAYAGRLPADEHGWAYELKWDGVRAVAYSRPGELRLESRNLNDITASYPELGALGAALGARQAVLDGEIVALDAHGRPSFAALQRRMHVGDRARARRLAADTPVTYMLFDLLWLDGHSLMALAYERRRELLSALELRGASWQTPERFLGNGRQLLAASAAQGLEGVVAKRLDSTYQPGLRSRAWVKVKTVRRQEFVVGGWMPGKGRRADTVGALLLGVHQDDGALRYVGRCGSGFSDAELARLSKLLRALRREDSPFAAGVGSAPPRGAQFCQPRLVAEVQFANWTADGRLRAPVYQGLRDDKDPGQVVREDDSGVGGAHDGGGGNNADGGRAHDAGAATRAGAERRPRGRARTVERTVDGRVLRLTNLDKVLYPATGFTKGQLIDYATAIAPVLLAHLAGRPLTVTRWPDGVESKSFFQKQAPAHRPPWVRTARVPAGSKPVDYVLAEDLPTLVWLANLAAVELHVPLARAPRMDRPTAVVFDLDPGAPATILECCRVALLLHGIFQGLALESFVKTSGSKGLQVYVPLNRPDAAYERTKPFARAVAELLEAEEGELVVARMTKTRRAGRVLIDWSQNDARKTTVCAYSLRATQRPNASTPLQWPEVQAALDAGDPHALAFDAQQALTRVTAHGDLFAPVLSLVQRLPG